MLKKMMILLFLLGLTYCTPEETEEEEAETKSMQDVTAMHQITTGEHAGKFVVFCRDGRSEIVTTQQIANDQVCPTRINKKIQCEYSGDLFIVAYNGYVYSENVHDFDFALPMACGDKLAAIYDRGDFIVFDSATQEFHTLNVVNDQDLVVIKVMGNLAFLYDQDDIAVYDYKLRKFYVDRTNNNLHRPPTLMNEDGILFYDDDAVYSYCAGGPNNWQNANATDGYNPFPSTSENMISLFVEDTTYSLNTKTCEFSFH